MGKVLIATDGSTSAKIAVEKAVQVKLLNNKKVIVVSVVPHMKSRMSYKTYAKLAEIEEKSSYENFAEEIKELVKKQAKEVEIKIELGNPPDEIVRVARELGVDFIVMGTKGTGGVVGALVGSVARSVIEKVSIPIFLVPYHH